MEDYLKAILVLHQQHGYVRCIDVADYLGVSKPSVSRAVKELTKSGHIIKKDGTLYLTQQGRQYAEQISNYEFRIGGVYENSCVRGGLPGNHPCSPKETRYGTLRRCSPAHGSIKTECVSCDGNLA